MNDLIQEEHEVVLLLADKFAPRLADLARHHHVWALKTPAMERIAHEYWDRHPRTDDAGAGAGITLFSGVGTPENDLLSIIRYHRAAPRDDQ